MNFQTGDFERERSRFRAFTPAQAVSSLIQLDPEAMYAAGKRLVLMDVDNTLVHHNEDAAQPEIESWLQRARQAGLDFCIVSNTNRLDRLQKIADSLGVSIVRGRMKPSRSMFRMAMQKFGVAPEQTIMVGDQLVTDVFGANRAGIDAVWVEKMPGSTEFVGTKVNRLIERFLTSFIYKALVASPPATGKDEPVIDSPAAVLEEIESGAAETPKVQQHGGIVRQLAKFLIVGASSFIIDAGITWVLSRRWSMGGELVSVKTGRWLMENIPAVFGHASEPGKASVWIFSLMAATVATYNGFYWNRRWTFEVTGDEGKARQLRRVYLLGYIGMGLNALFTQLFANVIPGHPDRSLLVAKFLAAAVVAVYNFGGQRFWAFKPDSSSAQKTA